MKLHSFPKEERLKSSKQISLLFSDGKRMKAYPLMMCYLSRDLPSKECPIKVGFSVSKRKFPNAAERNLIKRRMREAYRLNRKNIKEMLKARNKHIAVFFVYLGNEIETYKTITACICQLLERLQKT